ncbi:hypothetical protein KM043_011637 [Ampulex compressa]|nr:hypothetical protein KM043_011637 [Ampulex compressa]
MDFSSALFPERKGRYTHLGDSARLNKSYLPAVSTEKFSHKRCQPSRIVAGAFEKNNDTPYELRHDRLLAPENEAPGTLRLYGLGIVELLGATLLFYSEFSTCP